MTTLGEASKQILSAEGRAQAVSKQAESDRPFAVSSSSTGWLEAASKPLKLENPPSPPPTASTSEPPPTSRKSQLGPSEKQMNAQDMEAEKQGPTSSFKPARGSAPEASTEEERESLTSEQNGARSSEGSSSRPFSAEEGSESWLKAASMPVPEQKAQTETGIVSIKPCWAQALIIIWKPSKQLLHTNNISSSN